MDLKVSDNYGKYKNQIYKNFRETEPFLAEQRIANIFFFFPWGIR